MPTQAGIVALVSGASRGVGRGIARELGAAGATVYVTGRSTRLGGTASTAGRGETIEETAALVTAQGGQGIAVACDHTDDGQLAALFAQVHAEQGRLDLLVNNAWGGYEGHDDTFTAPFWGQPLARWEGMFGAGVRAAMLTSRYAARLMIAQQHGLIINTLAWDRGLYLGNAFYDVAKAAMGRMAFAMAHDLRAYGVTALALAPGFVRTETVLAVLHTDEQHWQTVPELARSESPAYIGRAVVALAGDPEVMRYTGATLMTGDLAQSYGFTDADGRQPPPFRIDDAGAAA